MKERFEIRNFQVNILSFILLIFISSNCANEILPAKELHPYITKEKVEINGNICTIKLSNPLECPLRFWIQSEDEKINEYFFKSNPILLPRKTDSIFTIILEDQLIISKLNFPSRYGDPDSKINQETISLPFKSNSTYKVVQGNNGSFSHSGPFSQYAIDFNLEIGDTIHAVANGYVVGVIEGYSKSGKTKKWKDYANYITLYHPEQNLFSQYVHLKKDGSLVALGDEIIENQAIAICGMTGFTDTEHLHFSMLKSVDNNDGLNTVPFEFKEGYKGIELKRGDVVKND